ncbi:hypothetical protein ACG7TL_005882 [Trametes sanguinea]
MAPENAPSHSAESSESTGHPSGSSRSLLVLLPNKIDIEEEARFYEDIVDSASTVGGDYPYGQNDSPPLSPHEAQSIFSRDIWLGDNSGESQAFARNVEIAGWTSVGDKRGGAYVVYDCVITTKEGLVVHALKRYSAFAQLYARLKATLPANQHANPYRTPPDFLALADAYPPLKPHIVLARNGPTIDFKNETAQRSLLTEAILLRDFSLKVELPPGRLCPPVPNRLNYILWLEDVVATTTLALELSGDRAVRGLDVGTGASAIYPLLGCRTNPTWSFTATELDELSLRFARQNVEGNNLQQRISVLSAGPSGPILAPLKDSDVVYDFTMCNPPFYSSREEVLQSAEAKEFEPNAVR